jgi:tetratricopeptide (TPR) repeat protein
MATAPSISRLGEKLGDLHALLGAYAQAQEDFARARPAQAASVRRAALWHKEGLMWEKQGDLSRAVLAFDAAEREGAEGATPLPPHVRAEVELGRAAVCYDRAEYEATEAAIARACAVLRGENPGRATVRLLTAAAWLQGMVANGRGDFAGQEECARRMLALAEGVSDLQGMGRAWCAQGVATVRLGRLTHAETCFRSGLPMLERVGDQEFIAVSWWGLGAVAEGRGELRQAEECYRDPPR